MLERLPQAKGVLVTAGAFLEKAGFQVSRAENGDQALALLDAGERFDALVSDYAMPSLNGLDLIEQARAVQPNLPALLITGFAEVGSADILPEAVAVLCKPFQRGVEPGKLFTPATAATQLLDVIDELKRPDSGNCLDWSGETIVP